MPLTLNNTNTLTADNIIVSGTNLSDLYVTQDDLNTATGGLITQQDVDDSIAPLISKDIAYNNTLTSHISLIDVNTTDIATNTADITILDTKNLTNFHSISSLSHLLNTDYQTTTQLNSNFVSPTTLSTNHYTKSEIDTTFTNYYTTTQTDAGFYSQTYINTNIYTKAEVDGLVGGSAGYTDLEIDGFLSLKEDKATFTDKISFTPVVDISAPTIIHNGLTLKNSTVNVEPVEGLLFSNQTGGGDKVISIFKNATNYITLQGNKIISNATSDDSIVNLDLNPSGNITVVNTLYTGAIHNTNVLTTGSIDITNNLTVGGLIEMTDANTTLDRYVNATKVNTSLDIRTDEDALRLMTGTATDGDSNTHLECDKANSKTIFYKDTDFRGNLDLTSSTGDILLPTAGFDMFRNSGDANYNLRIRDTQGVFEFINRNFRCMNPSNPNNGTEFILHDTGGDYRLRIGSISTATVGIGRQYNVSYHLTVGGVSNFNETRVENDATFLGQQLLNTKSRVFQRSDANNSLNIIGEKEINFSLQTDRTTDPTTGSIALQLNDNPSSITMNRATTMNQTLNVIGKLTAEADLDVWGSIVFEHSSAIYENLNGSDYDLILRNGDTDRAIDFIIGTIGSTPELSLTEGKVNLLGNLEITHVDVSGSQRVLINNPDTDGFIRLSNNNLSRLDATNTGVDVYGVLTTTGNADINGTCTCVALVGTSDSKLKENIREVSNKKCYDVVKYIQPKTFNLTKDEDKKSNLGMIADDVKDAKLPPEWDNIIFYNDDGMKLLAYNKLTVILWGAVKQIMTDKDELVDMVKTMKKEIATMKGEITKLKKKIKDDD